MGGIIECECTCVEGIIKCQGVQPTVKLWGNAALVGSYVLIDSLAGLLACEKGVALVEQGTYER